MNPALIAGRMQPGPIAVNEAGNATGTEWGLGGLKQTVRANLPAAGSALINCLLADAQAFTGTREFADDVCLAAVELREE